MTTKQADTDAPAAGDGVEREADAIERHECPGCGAPAGSPCKTRAGVVAARYHVARFALVPSLREQLSMRVPPSRGPGAAWVAPLPRNEGVAAAAETPSISAAIRIGYARTSTARQELGSQLTALRSVGCHTVFEEQISTRVKDRPELAAALSLARSFKDAAPDQVVILTVHEMKRLARGAAELMTLSADLQSAGIRLELLAGPLTGIYDPDGMGAMLFAVLAVAAQLERDYIREKTIEGQVHAAANGRIPGRPQVFDDAMLIHARALRDAGMSVPDIAATVKITSGKRAGQCPSLASVYRALRAP